MTRIQQLALAAAAAAGGLSSASAASTFEGRLANGTPSSTCTVSGVDKCAMFYNTTLNITILNNWNIATGVWTYTGAVGSAQWFAALAGRFGSNFQTGWVLPTGDQDQAPGALNQYRSIWNELGSTFAGLSAQFDGVQSGLYWSGSAYAPIPIFAWYFNTANGVQNFDFNNTFAYYVVAVRPGDVAAVPEPKSYAMLLAGLAALVVAVRRRRRRRV